MSLIGFLDRVLVGRESCQVPLGRPDGGVRAYVELLPRPVWARFDERLLIRNAGWSAGELAEEIGFVHAVLEGFAAIDEDYRDFVGELAAELFVAVHVYFLPGEAATAM
jgi:hypothetical protein